MKTQELVDQIADLPVKQRADIADQILQTLNQPDPAVEKAWAKEARRWLKEFEEGKIEVIPGEQVERELRENIHNDLSVSLGSPPRIRPAYS